MDGRRRSFSSAVSFRSVLDLAALSNDPLGNFLHRLPLHVGRNVSDAASGTNLVNEVTVRTLRRLSLVVFRIGTARIVRIHFTESLSSTLPAPTRLRAELPEYFRGRFDL
jgi:hypothetical protein